MIFVREVFCLFEPFSAHSSSKFTKIASTSKQFFGKTFNMGVKKCRIWCWFRILWKMKKKVTKKVRSRKLCYEKPNSQTGREPVLKPMHQLKIRKQILCEFPFNFKASSPAGRKWLAGGRIGWINTAHPPLRPIPRQEPAQRGGYHKNGD